MFIIGEKINTTRKGVARAVRERDSAYIQDTARAQMEAGAHTLDVNCGTLRPEDEAEALAWLVQTVQEACPTPLCLDSSNPAALAAGLAAHQGKAMLNSISAETARYRPVLDLARTHGASLVALNMDDSGIPPNLDRARILGESLVSRLLDDGLALDDIYFDPLVRSLATTPLAVLETLELIRHMAARFPGMHFVSGLSNVSYGLPERRHLNRAYAVMSILSGLDAVIMDPLDAGTMALIQASRALLNQDRFCLKYIEAYHQGRLSA